MAFYPIQLGDIKDGALRFSYRVEDCGDISRGIEQLFRESVENKRKGNIWMISSLSNLVPHLSCFDLSSLAAAGREAELGVLLSDVYISGALDSQQLESDGREIVALVRKGDLEGARQFRDDLVEQCRKKLYELMNEKKTYDDFLSSFRLSPYGMTDPPSFEKFVMQLHFFRRIELLAEEQHPVWNPESLFFRLSSMNYEEYFANCARETETRRYDTNAEVLLKWRWVTDQFELQSPMDVLMFVHERLESCAKTEEEVISRVVKNLARGLIPHLEGFWGTLLYELLSMITEVHDRIDLHGIEASVNQFLESSRPVCLDGFAAKFSVEDQKIYDHYRDTQQIKKSYEGFSQQEVAILYKLVWEISKERGIPWKNDFPSREGFEFLLTIESEAMRFKQVESISLLELIENISNYSLLYTAGEGFIDDWSLWSDFSEEEYNLFRQGLREGENLLSHYALHLVLDRLSQRRSYQWEVYNPWDGPKAGKRLAAMESRVAFGFELLKRHILLSGEALSEAMRDEERDQKVKELDARVSALENGAPVHDKADVFEKMALLTVLNRRGLRISESILTEWLDICQHRDFSGTIPEGLEWNVHKLQVSRQPEVDFHKWKQRLGEVLRRFHKNKKQWAHTFDIHRAQLPPISENLQDAGEYRCLKTLKELAMFYSRFPRTQETEKILIELSQLKRELSLEETGTVSLRLKPSRTVLDSFAAKIVANSLGTLWGRLADGFIRYALTDEHYHPYRIYIDGIWSGMLMTHTYENMKDSGNNVYRRVLILHGIEMKSNDLLNPEDFLIGLRDQFQKAAEEAGYDLVLLPKSPKTQTNMKQFFRPEIPLLGLREICFPEGYYFPKVGPTEEPKDSYNSASRYLWSTRKPENPIEPHRDFLVLWADSGEYPSS